MPRRRLSHQRVAHKSTGGMLLSIPEPVDPVGNPPSHLTSNTVAHPRVTAIAERSNRRAACPLL
jgi:hypothetical protein